MCIAPARTLSFLSLNRGHTNIFSPLAQETYSTKWRSALYYPVYCTLQATAWTFKFKQRFWHLSSDVSGRSLEVSEVFQSIGTGFSCADTKYPLSWHRMGRRDVGPEECHLRCSSCCSSRVWVSHRPYAMSLSPIGRSHISKVSHMGWDTSYVGSWIKCAESRATQLIQNTYTWSAEQILIQRWYWLNFYWQLQELRHLTHTYIADT